MGHTGQQEGDINGRHKPKGTKSKSKEKQRQRRVRFSRREKSCLHFKPLFRNTKVGRPLGTKNDRDNSGGNPLFSHESFLQNTPHKLDARTAFCSFDSALTAQSGIQEGISLNFIYLLIKFVLTALTSFMFFPPSPSIASLESVFFVTNTNLNFLQLALSFSLRMSNGDAVYF